MITPPALDAPWFSHYETGVPHTVAVPEKLLHTSLTETAKRIGASTAIGFAVKYLPLGLSIGSNLTYRQLDDASDRFAAALQELGIRKGDRVAIMLPNVPELPIAFFGILKAGAICVNINPTYPSYELKHVLADCGARAIVMLSGLVERLAPIRDEIAIEHVIVTDVGDSVGQPFRMLVERQVRATGMMTRVDYVRGVHPMAQLMGAAPAEPEPVAMTPDDPVLFQYTGGTTGVPKAAMLTHRNLVANCLQMEAWLTDITFGQEVMLLALPAFHVYGMSVGMLLGVHIGAKIVMVPNPRETAHIIQAISREKVTFYPAVPAMYIAIINNPLVHKFNLTSVKACLSGGSALPGEVAQQFEALTGGKLVEGYGLTETSPLAVGNPIYGDARVGSIGLPFPSTNCAICALEPDAEGNFARLSQGEEGELIIQGPQVMKGYWQMEDETAKAIDNEGWLHTGDIARMDADGYFYIVDRKKDLIIASGFNVVPREVEEVLFQHPKVLEAAVAGVPHPKRGETVKAYVVPRAGVVCSEDELRLFCKERLAPYKVPTAVEFRKELPMTQAGKVLRRQLVEEEKAKLAAT
jgi:long-chain acyl-CoA synthetase